MEQVAEGVGGREPNVDTLLNAMVEAGWLEIAPDAEPTPTGEHSGTNALRERQPGPETASPRHPEPS